MSCKGRGRGNFRGGSGGGGGVYKGNQRHGFNRNSSNTQGRSQQIGYRILSEWEHFEGPDLIVRIFERYKDFKTLLNSDVTRQKDMFRTLTQVLSKSCETSTQIQKKYELLELLKESVYFKERLSTFIREMAEEDSRDIIDEYPKIIPCILSICSNILYILRTPTVIPVADLKEALDQLEERSIITTEDHKYIFDTFEKLQKDRKRMIREASAARRNDHAKDTRAPPCSFRDMNVVPDIKDLTEPNPFIRCNIVQGPYPDGEHYLDVMFRLHREDLVRPLRESIRSYRSSKQDTRKSYVQKCVGYQYSGVRIDLTPKIIDSEVIYKLHFDRKSLDHVSWETSKRLMYGCLLCLSPDNFKSVLMATVASRETYMLEEGMVQVRFENMSHDEISDHVKADRKYIMIESPAYYEAYKHVLHRMKEISGDIPFHKYIVSVQRMVDPPQYIALCHSPADIKYNLKCLLTESSEKKDIYVLRSPEWPKNEDMELDPSQRKAIQHALQSELTIIQGPPGTGKTYIGLKIVQVLLDNIHAWCSDGNKKPILIITYTNHALDQFLEGVLKFTTNIVRVGNRSKSVRLTNKNLNALLGEYTATSEDAKSRLNVSREVSYKHSKCISKLNDVREKLESLGRECVVHERELQNVMKPYHLKTLRERWIRDGKQSLLLRWLSTQTSSLCSGDYVPHYKLVEDISLKSVDHEEQSIRGAALENPTVTEESLEGDLLEKEKRDTVSEQTIPMKLYQSTLHDEGQMASYLHLKSESFADSDQTVPMKLYMSSDTSTSYEKKRESSILYQSSRDVLVYATNETEPCESTSQDQKQSHNHQVYRNDEMMYEEETILKETDPPLVVDEESERFEIEESRYVLPCDDLLTDGLFDTDEDDFFEVFRKKRSLRLQLKDQYANENANIDELLGFIRKQLARVDKMSDEEEDQISDENLWALDENQRWRLYRLWICRYIDSLQEEKEKILKEYDGLQKIKKETDLLKKREIMKDASVIGMTTTAAAKMINILREVKSPVLVFEEAAEVLEGHCLSTLTEHCQHLIQLGDHQQLQPKPAVYSLGKEFNLDVSLFERMIRNRVPYIQLQVQHRMRPEISAVLKHIYKCDIIDHPSVEHFENILGVVGNLFFVSHSKVEHNQDSEIKSPANEHEAQFLVRFAEYLTKQGYNASNITILTMYSGQVKCIKSHLEERRIDTGLLQVRTVDNFQGKENDIILLSLVRSNAKGIIGFLDVENRVCVSLTRARKGLYCIGNLNQLKSNQLWKEVIEDMQKQTRVGPRLELKCQKHGNSTFISDHSDFDNVLSGGCGMMCGDAMACGHTCPKRCHPGDHPDCVQPCRNIICSRDHLCTEKCGETCSTFCRAKVSFTVSLCGHTVKYTCKDIPTSTSEIKCTLPCGKVYACGHKCQLKCGEPCGIEKCDVLVAVKKSCGHTNYIPCNEKDLPLPCSTPCNVQLTCGHRCSGTCGVCLKGRHKTCLQKCERLLPCGDKCEDVCGFDCQPCSVPCRNKCVHGKCSKPCGLACEHCMQNCAWVCDHSRCTKKCWELCDKRSCDEPCPKRIKCGHPCVGLCGEKCPTKCPICHSYFFKQKFRKAQGKRFIELSDCGHIFEVNFLDAYMSKHTTTQMVCPVNWCRTLITRSFRYGNLIKQKLSGLEEQKSELREKYRLSPLVKFVS